METKIRFIVDAAHCQRAADELNAILREQERAFVTRWHSSKLISAAVKTARAVGMSASALGLALCTFLLYFDTRSWSTQPSIWFSPIFVAIFLVLLFQPPIGRRIREWSLGKADRRARRNAERAVRAARRLAPFELDYDLKGDLLVYSRGKDGAWRLVWHRVLRKFQPHGLAVQSASVTAIFRRPSSLVPSVVILQQSREWPATVLREIGITLESRPAYNGA
jgi:hypothetical protein